VSTAQVHNLDLARQGRDSVARRSNGYRLGDHGKRTSALTREAAINQLREVAKLHGNVTRADKERAAERADVTVRTINNWWSKACLEEVAHLRDDNEMPGMSHLVMPAYLYRFAEPDKLQLTQDEIAFFGQAKPLRNAIAAVRADPTNRLSHYSESTLYAAWGNVTASVRAGARDGAAAQRALEATWPLTGRDRINETWSIDEYDLKVRSRDERGAPIEPKLLCIRDRASGLPLAYTVLKHGARGADTGVLLAAAALGFTTTHPDDANGTLEVSGVARLLVSDQGGALLGDEARAAARRLGIGNSPIASHTPQSNGDHEQMHQSLLAHFGNGPGSRRGWTDIAGQRADHGDLPFDTVVEEVGNWFATYITRPFQGGPHKGRSRLGVYADLTAAGDVYDGPTLTEEDEGSVGYWVGERTYDATRGLHYDNQYWLSSALADAANPGERITLRQLIDPGTLYAYDSKGRFIGTVAPRAEAIPAEVETTHAHRARRHTFVQNHIAKPKAASASADAQDAWDAVADGLVDAADHASLYGPLADTSEDEHSVAPIPDLHFVAPSAAAQAPDRQASHRPRPQRTSLRSRKVPPPTEDQLPDTDSLDAIADLYGTTRSDDVEEPERTDG
tara:strand:+ start:159 stop:2021 length:1863 start_codon:yes stop_codon:yes gene_type:complete